MRTPLANNDPPIPSKSLDDLVEVENRDFGHIARSNSSTSGLITTSSSTDSR
jgi:hypothetical protein